MKDLFYQRRPHFVTHRFFCVEIWGDALTGPVENLSVKQDVEPLSSALVLGSFGA
jgi:hypothetical protein